MKTVIVFLLTVLALTFAFGVVFAESELANPWKAREQADMMKAQREALEAENQIRLKWLEQEQAVNMEALKAQQAQEADHREFWFQLKSRGLEALVKATTTTFAVLGRAGAFYLLCAGIALLRQQKQPTTEVAQEGRRAISLPGLLQRARILTHSSAAALVLLVLGVAVLAVSVASLVTAVLS